MTPKTSATAPDGVGEASDGSVVGAVSAGRYSTPAEPTTENLLVEFFVAGTPKPKGSMRHVGKGRMIEQVEGSKPWREAVKYAALRARGGMRPPITTGPVRVDIIVTFNKPASAPKTRRIWPITRTSGDADKQARNILDAVVDANLLHDDSQVIDLRVRKCFVNEELFALRAPGAHVRIYDLGTI